MSIAHIISLIIFISGSSFLLSGQNSSLVVPEGAKPLVDGNIEPNEWDDSAKLPFCGGKSVFVLSADDTLYIALKGRSGGITSLALGNQDEFRILHASTGLITATYTRYDGSWHLKNDFKGPLTEEGERFPRGNIRFTDDYKQAQLQQFNWYANLVDMGDPSETEYQVPLFGLRTEDVFLSIVFFQVRAEVKKAILPANLSDGCLNQELISGSAREGLQFNPGS